MVGGGLALMIVPGLTDAAGWRAAYWSAALLAVAAIVPTLAATGLPSVGHSEAGYFAIVLATLGVLQAATFGLAVVAGTGRYRCSSGRARALPPPASQAV